MRSLIVLLLGVACACTTVANAGEVTSPSGGKWRVDRSDLLKAIWTGDLERLRGFIAEGEDFDDPFVHHADLIEKLNSGFKTASMPPLCAAVQTGDSEVVRLVLGQVKDVDATFKPAEYTALFMAAELPSPRAEQIATMLLASGADLHHADQVGRTALMQAAGHGQPTMVALLLDAGADVRQATRYRTTALYDATHRNDHRRYLCSRMIEVRISGGRSPLMEASARGRIDDVRRLLAEGAVPGEQDEQGWTALIWAAAPGGSPDVVEALLAAGADPNAVTNGGWTALMSAVVSRDPRRVAALLAAGADPSARERAECIGPLVMSVWHPSPQVFELLVAAGAQVHDHLESGRMGVHDPWNRNPPGFNARVRDFVKSVEWAEAPEQVRLVRAHEMPWRLPPGVHASNATIDGSKLTFAVAGNCMGWDVAFSVSLRQGEREIPVGELALPQPEGSPGHWVTVDISGFDQGPFEVVFRPDRVVAARRLRTWEIWGEEMVTDLEFRGTR